MGVKTGHNLSGNIERTVHRNQESNENEANVVLDCRRVSFALVLMEIIKFQRRESGPCIHGSHELYQAVG